MEKDTILDKKMITGSLSLERQLNHGYRLIVTDRGFPTLPWKFPPQRFPREFVPNSRTLPMLAAKSDVNSTARIVSVCTT